MERRMPDEQANDVDNVTDDDVKKPTCGIIMPISATINHTAAHWIDVRTLISRAIEKANFVAAPVWENSTIDRVSERIIGNIFQFDLAIADISDSNPNVMLELGLRLASKKPTIVIINAGGNIPFDIRDFHALEYPASLSMLEMETFIDTLAKTLTAKHAASQEEGYTPFLGKVVVDVVQPGERQLPLDKYFLNRLDEISAKINQQLPSFRTTGNSYLERDRTISVSDSFGTTFYFELPSGSRSTLNRQLAALGISAEIDLIGGADDNAYYSVEIIDLADEKTKKAISKTMDNLVSSLGGSMGIPSDIFTILRRSKL
jgi:hypothetical protein